MHTFYTARGKEWAKKNGSRSKYLVTGCAEHTPHIKQTSSQHCSVSWSPTKEEGPGPRGNASAGMNAKVALNCFLWRPTIVQLQFTITAELAGKLLRGAPSSGQFQFKCNLKAAKPPNYLDTILGCFSNGFLGRLFTFCTCTWNLEITVANLCSLLTIVLFGNVM